MTRSTDTDTYIAQLAAQPASEPFRAGRMTGAMMLALGAGLTGILILLGVRPDLLQSVLEPRVLAKWLLAVPLAVLAFPAALALTRPDAKVQTGWLWLPVLAAGVVFIVTLLGTPIGTRGAEVMGQTIRACLLSISVLSLAPIAVAIRYMRRGATTRPILSGFLTGLASGSAAAAGYAVHCTEDSPLFYITWYGTGILIAACIGAWAGHRYLRW